MSEPEPVVFNPFTPEFRNDPYPSYRWLRETAPVLHSPLGVWLVSHYRDVEAIVRDHRFGHPDSADGGEATVARPGGDDLQSFLVMNPPDHTRLRGLVNKAFTPRLIGRLEPRIRELAGGLLKEAVSARDVDLMSAFCYPLALTVICELIGIPARDEKLLREWSRALTLVIEPPIMLSAEDHAAVERASGEFFSYLDDLIAARRAHPTDDLLSRLIAVEEAGDRLTTHEMRLTCALLLMAGYETSALMIGNGAYALLRNPEQLAVARAGLPGKAADEFLRYDASVQITQRVVLEDGVTVAGRVIPRGDPVILLLGSANRDPEAFSDPDRLDLTRSDSTAHLSFSGGIHFCLGAALARLELQVAMEALVSRSADLQFAGEPTRRESLLLRGPEILPVLFG